MKDRESFAFGRQAAVAPAMLACLLLFLPLAMAGPSNLVSQPPDKIEATADHDAAAALWYFESGCDEDCFAIKLTCFSSRNFQVDIGALPMKEILAAIEADPSQFEFMADGKPLPIRTESLTVDEMSGEWRLLGSVMDDGQLTLKFASFKSLAVRVGPNTHKLPPGKDVTDFGAMCAEIGK